MRLAVVLVSLVASLALVGSGCGGQDEPQESAAVAWAEELCADVRNWTDELKRIGDDITDPASLSIDALKDAASDVGIATDVFLTEVRGLGAPDTESGAEAQRLLESLADTVESEKKDIEAALGDVSGITGLASAVGTIASSLTTMGREFQQTFERLGEIDASGELSRAFEQADTCSELTAS